MTPAVVIGPVITLAIWLGWLASVLVAVRRTAGRSIFRTVHLEIVIAALLISTLQLLLNLTLRHFGDVTVSGTHAAFMLIACATRRPPALPRAWIYRG